MYGGDKADTLLWSIDAVGAFDLIRKVVVMIKKILVGVVILVVVLVAAAVIVPFLIPTDTIKQELQAQVKAATGRDLAIDGDFAFSLLPEATLKAGKVRFQNAAGGSRPDMVTLKELRVHVALLPLLSSKVEVKEFVLDEPDILLEVDKNGKANWAFGGGASGAGGSSSGASGGSGGSGLQGVSLGDVRIVNGRLAYKDAKAGTTETVEAMNLKIDLPSLDHPFSATGGATWHKEALDLKIGAKSLRALMEGGATDVSLSLDGKPLKLAYAGAVDAGKHTVGGKLDLDVPSVRGLAAWVGSPVAVKGDDVLNALKISGQLAASPAAVSFNGMSLSLDKITTTGDLSAALGGAAPSVKGKLAVEALDLNPYLAAFGGGAEAGGAAKPAAGSASNEWSDEPIDMSALKSVNADLT